MSKWPYRDRFVSAKPDAAAAAPPPPPPPPLLAGLGPGPGPHAPGDAAGPGGWARFGMWTLPGPLGAVGLTAARGLGGFSVLPPIVCGGPPAGEWR